MGHGLAFSVLDLVGMRAGEPAGSAIARSVDLAQHVEQWGYKRYWLAEHHSISGLACSATPVLIGHVAAATKTIRVGSGGVMLPNHAPLVVAEQFGTLGALYPGRIDLGLGRAPGGDYATMRALRRASRATGGDFPELRAEVGNGVCDARPGQAGEGLAVVEWMEPLWSEFERAAVESRLGAAIVGSDATVKAGMEKLARETGAAELIVVTDTYTHEDRLESYRRVAEIAAAVRME